MAFLEARGITKKYGAILANDDVSFKAEKGELTALLGENGAGKTTLARILAGEERPDKGEVYLDGSPFRRSGRLAGAPIGLVHQHPLLAEDLSVSENISLGHEPQLASFFLDRKRMLMKAALVAGEFGFSINPAALVRDLSPSEKQEAEILKALSRGVEAIILDEPTSLLARDEAESLYRLLRRLVDAGKAVIVVTHRLPEVSLRADKFFFLRDGKNSGESRIYKEDEAFAAMFGISGRENRDRPGKVELARKDRPMLEAKGIGRGGIAFDARPSEIVGFVALAGNGLEELERELSGKTASAPGKLFLFGRDIGKLKTGKRRELGMAYLPTDRLRVGLNRSASMAENLLALDGRKAFGFPGRSKNEMKALAREKAEAFDFHGDPSRPAGTLSGGQMQAVMLARELSGGKPFILACNPTWGLDRLAREKAIGALKAAKAGGAGILLLSSDLEEALDAADRIIALYRGRKVFEAANGPNERLGDDLARAMVGSR